MGYNYYSRANKGLFTINKPKGLCVGIDSLPEFVKNSNEFTGNELGKLGSVLEIPSVKDLDDYKNLNIRELYIKCKIFLENNQIDYAWEIIHAIATKLDGK